MLNQNSARLLTEIKAVIAQYPNIKMTVRQVYYRLVAAHLIKNDKKEYDRIKRVLTIARLEGSVSFDDIEDRTRTVLEGEVKERSAKSYFDAYYDQFKTLDRHYELPYWYGQPNKVVVLVEKQALEGIFSDVCKVNHVDLLVCRGYPSLSVLNELAKRLNGQGTKQIKLLYHGDYDPSGLDIDRNVAERLKYDFGVTFEFERVAITPAQIKHYDIPPAPAKLKDTRTAGMMRKVGDAMQVELDAIDPPDLQQIIRGAINKHFNRSIHDNERQVELDRRQSQIESWVKNAFKGMI